MTCRCCSSRELRFRAGSRPQLTLIHSSTRRLYGWLLHQPHEDKIQQERLVYAAAGIRNEDLEVNQKEQVTLAEPAWLTDFISEFSADSLSPRPLSILLTLIRSLVSSPSSCSAYGWQGNGQVPCRRGCGLGIHDLARRRLALGHDASSARSG